MHVKPGLLFCALLSAALPSPIQAAVRPAYSIGATIELGAPSRWDYLSFDATSHRIYVAHGDRVDVVDARNGRMVGKVEGMPGGTHGIGVSTVTGQGFTDDGKAGVVVPFDLATLAKKPAIKVGEDADGIIVDPATNRVFVIDGDPGTLSVVDPETDALIATIDGGGALEFGVADGLGHLYVDGKDRNEIVRVDTRSERVDAHWPMPDCVGPHGLAIDIAARRLFAGCAKKVLTVMNADTGAIVATMPIGAGNDGVAFDPLRKLILSANGRDGTLTVIKEAAADSFVPVGDVATAHGARTLAIDPQSGRVFLATSGAAASEKQPETGRGEPSDVGGMRLIVLDPSKPE